LVSNRIEPGLFADHYPGCPALPQGFRRQLAEGFLILAGKVAQVVESIGKRCIANGDVRAGSE
jgi:hypothetical protein